jgi:hypothetical protein
MKNPYINPRHQQILLSVCQIIITETCKEKIFSLWTPLNVLRFCRTKIKLIFTGVKIKTRRNCIDRFHI